MDVRKERGVDMICDPEGRSFESHSSRHVGTLDNGQVLHSQLPVALRRVNSDTVSMQ